MKVTLKNLLELDDAGIEFKFLKRDPRKVLLESDTAKSLGGDTLELQGALDSPRSPSSLPSISLDTTYGLSLARASIWPGTYDPISLYFYVAQ